MADTKKRVRRTAEEIDQDFDTKIAYHEKCIESLKAKKEQALSAKAKKNTIKTLVEKAQEQGMSAEEIAEKLGVSL